MPQLKDIYTDNLLKTGGRGNVYQNVLTDAQSINTYTTPRTSLNPNQPFIYIGPGTDNTTPGVFKGNNGAFLSTSRIKDDIRLFPYGTSVSRDNNRIINFLKSPAGVTFLAKQFTLQAFNPYPNTKIFNPASILASTVPGVHVARFIDTAAFTGFGRGVGQGISQLFNSTFSVGTKIVAPIERVDTGYGDNGYFTNKENELAGAGNVVKNKFLKYLREEFSSITNLGRPKLKSNIRDPMNTSQPTSVGVTGNFKINYGFLQKTTNTTVGATTKQTKIDKDIINFTFKAFSGDVKEEAFYFPFRAFISRLTENVKPEYNEQRYVGRTERFITYAGAKRTIQLDFNIVAFSEDEINSVWTRVNYLTGLAFPKGISQTGFIQPQLFRITIGKIYEDQPCYIDTLDYDFMDESITFDIDKGVSQFINVKMSLSLIEKTTRYYDSPFYKIMEEVANAQANRPVSRIEQLRNATEPDADPRLLNNLLSNRSV